MPTRARSHDVPVIVGGAGERRTLRIAARLGDGCNVPVDVVEDKAAVLRRHCEEVGRDPAEVAVTVLDLPVVGRDRDDVWERVERLRGRTAAATYARRHHAGTPDAAPRPLRGRSPTAGSTPSSWRCRTWPGPRTCWTWRRCCPDGEVAGMSGAGRRVAARRPHDERPTS